jgi:hypothetical protein
MAEWFKAAVLKTVERKFRGFESYSLRHSSLGRQQLALLAESTNFWFFIFINKPVLIDLSMGRIGFAV